METIFANADITNENAFKQAGELLHAGELVAFPTETVYGLGGDALNPAAAGKIYDAKGRPSDNPLIVHIAHLESVEALAAEIPENAKLLMEAFWPGPLTIIFKKKDVVPKETTGGLNTVAIRMPSHPAALKMIGDAGTFVAAPSANLSGRPSPTTAEHVLEDMNGRIPLILNGGAVGIGIESTIVDVTSPVPTILRPGFITAEMLRSIVGEVHMDPALESVSADVAPKAPGMKYTHYAPKGDLSIVEGEAADVVAKINALVADGKAKGQTAAVICAEENAGKYICEHVLVAGTRKDDLTIAAALYRVLRECDNLGADLIYSESFGDGTMGYAIMNRLMKAAGHRIIKA